MHQSFCDWRKERRRRLHSLLAAIPLGKPPGPGGKIPLPQETKGVVAAAEEKPAEGNKHKHQGAKASEKNKEQLKGKPHPADTSAKDSEDEAKEKEEDKPPVARIVAYSDSEGEDEPFLKRRRKKLKEVEEAATEEEGEGEGEPAEGVLGSTPARGQLVEVTRRERRLLRAARLCSRQTLTQARRVREGCTWSLLLQLVVLWLVRRWRPRPVQRFELLTLAISLPDAIASTRGWRQPSSRLPSLLQQVTMGLKSWASPSLLVLLASTIQGMVPKRKRRRILTTISQTVRVFQEAEEETSPEGTTPKKRAFPKLASDVAAMFKVELAEMKRILQTQAVRLPPDRFDDTNAELLRFASACGLLQAASPEEKALAIQEGCERILKTLDWLRKHRFMPPAQLKEWQHMVRWQGTDSEGVPILVIKASKACAECQGSSAEAVAEAIIGQMQRAVTEVFSNQHGPDRLVVVMDASDASSLSVTRNVALFKQVSVTLNKHYPHRLQQLYLVEFPTVLRWVLATVKHLLHPRTREKIRTIAITDPALPLPASVLQSPRFDTAASDASTSSQDMDAVRSRERRLSIPELPVSSESPIPMLKPPRRINTPELPMARDTGAPQRRVRIPEAPVQEPDKHAMRPGGSYSGGFLRPALKRSMSVGLIGLETGQIDEVAERHRKSMALPRLPEREEADDAYGLD